MHAKNFATTPISLDHTHQINHAGEKFKTDCIRYIVVLSSSFSIGLMYFKTIGVLNDVFRLLAIMLVYTIVAKCARTIPFYTIMRVCDQLRVNTVVMCT